MITVITGLPGNGKTLYALDWVKRWAEKDGREVHYNGIADLKLPWFPLDDVKAWHALPPKAIIVIDEVWKHMGLRPNGSKVPEFIEKLATHRHYGVDIVLITQHPSQLDGFVRKLAGQHFHVVRKFGTHRAVVHEWGAIKDQPDKNRSDSIRHDWKYPKQVFEYYKSAEAHTHKARIPMKVWLLIGIIVGLPLLAVYMWFYRFGPGATKPAGPVGVPGQPGLTMQSPSGGSQKMTPKDYVAAYRPRVEGLAYTAPVYDEVTKPVDAPYPAACVKMADRCGCYSQQGTKVDTPKAMCEQIVAGGFFVAWKQPVAQAVARVAPARQDEPQGLQTGLQGIPYTPSAASAPQSVLAADPGHDPGTRGRALPRVGS